MQLKEFIKKTILDIVGAVEESSSEAVRSVDLRPTQDSRTLEFDLAVSVEENDKVSGRGGIRVLEFVEGGGSIEKEMKNSTVSRIKFGVDVSGWTKEEEVAERARIHGNRVNRLKDQDPYA